MWGFNQKGRTFEDRSVYKKSILLFFIALPFWRSFSVGVTSPDP
jgi:hypothetical protein